MKSLLSFKWRISFGTLFGTWIWRCLLSGVLVAASLNRLAHADPQVQIISASTWGQAGSITGIVTGITDFQDYVINPWLNLDSVGWYNKPTDAQHTVPINSDGTFTANVTYPGTNDPYASIYFAGLLRATASAPQSPRTTSPLPSDYVASTSFERYNATLEFAGRSWAVKGPYPAGPLTIDSMKPNYFSNSSSAVKVDNLGLHLTVQPDGSRWDSTEVILPQHLGYGTYAFKTNYDVNSLDPNLTFGAFTYDQFGHDTHVPFSPNREIDFEDTRFGKPADPTNSQMVVQPYQNNPPNRYTVPDGNVTLTRFFTWRPGSIHFVTLLGDKSPYSYSPSDVVQDYTFNENEIQGHLVPTPGMENFRFNLWVNSGTGPSNNQPVDVLITGFSFSAFTPVTTTWIGASSVDGHWSTTANWQSGLAPSAAGNFLQFGPTSAPGNHVDSVNDLAAGSLVTGIVFQPGAPTFSIGGNQIQFNGPIQNQSGSDQTISMSLHLVGTGATVDAGSRTITITGPISGASPFVKSGSGILILTGSNTYTGGTSVLGGTLTLQATVGLPGAGPLEVSASDGVTSNLNLDYDQEFTSLSGTVTGTGSATINIGQGVKLFLLQTQPGNMAYGGIINNSGTFRCSLQSSYALEVNGAPKLNDNSVILVDSGRLRFNVNSGAATIGTAATISVSAFATLELAGSISALSSGSHRVNIQNNGSAAGLLVTGRNQVVGNIDGTGTTQINAGSDLTANHINQAALVIGGMAGSPTTVSITASDASGNPLATDSAAFVLASSLEPVAAFGADFITVPTVVAPHVSSSESDIALSASATIGLNSGSKPLGVPEPSGLILAVVGAAALFAAALRKRKTPPMRPADGRFKVGDSWGVST